MKPSRNAKTMHHQPYISCNDNKFTKKTHTRFRNDVVKHETPVISNDLHNESPTRSDRRPLYFTTNELQICRLKYNIQNNFRAERIRLDKNIKFIRAQSNNVYRNNDISEGYCSNNKVKMLCHNIQISKAAKKTDIKKSIDDCVISRMELNHINLLDCYGYRLEKGFLSIFYEVPDVCSLNELIITCNKFNYSMVAYYAKQIIYGLEYLHTYDIKHLSLYPDNLFLTNAMTVKLGPFNCFNDFVELKEQNNILEMRYMAPEVY